jgi:hypothetical protein
MLNIMASELQIETSRRNGAKSRGPRTPVGKAISSRNATTHGVLSKTIVIEGESAPRFAALLASIRADIQPRNTIEDSMVEDLAVCRWRLRRLLCMETALFTREIRRQDPEAASEIPPILVALVLNQCAPDSRALELISRYERQFNRQYTRTLRTIYDFRALQARDAV